MGPGFVVRKQSPGMRVRATGKSCDRPMQRSVHRGGRGMRQEAYAAGRHSAWRLYQRLLGVVEAVHVVAGGCSSLWWWWWC